ncbi:MAG: hypothetical protein IJ639_08435, partial [Ruminococcus sp.]|nr:hypothetical protein [Ruminococcus sp.]
SLASTGNPNVTWPAVIRGTSSTYYPVTESTSTSSGYWNLSVLVDGTYENLIYDTLTDTDRLGTGNANTGILEYSLDGGTTWVTLMDQSGTDDNRIDAYRWYVPCAAGSTVTYRWTPYYGADMISGTYDDTVFYFEHNTADGLYCVVTEAENEMVFNTTPVIRRSAASLSAIGFETQIEQSSAEVSDNAAETEADAVSDESVEDLYVEESTGIDDLLQD